MAGNSKTDLLWRFLADTKSLDRGSRDAKRQLSGVEKSSNQMARGIGFAKRAIGALGIAFGAIQVKNFAVGAIKASRDLTESTNAVARSYGDAADEIADLGEVAAAELGLSKNATNELAVAFAGFAKQIDGIDSTEFEVIARRAADFASVMNIEVDEAMATFSSGLAGQSRPLQGYGIDLSAASVKAFALEKGIGAANRELTASEKVTARYGLILRRTDQFAGDFVETSGDLANRTRILSARWENFQATLGEKGIPAATAAITALDSALEELPIRLQRWQREMSRLRKDLLNVSGALGIASDESRHWARTMHEAEKQTVRYLEEVRKGVDGNEALAFAFGNLIRKGEATTDTLRALMEGTGNTTFEMLIAANQFRDTAKATGFMESEAAAAVETILAMRNAQAQATVTAAGLNTPMAIAAARGRELAESMEAAWLASHNADGSLRGVGGAASDIAPELASAAEKAWALAAGLAALGNFGSRVFPTAPPTVAVPEPSVLPTTSVKPPAHIPGTFAHGGNVPGPLGSPQAAIVHGGEKVLTAGQARNRRGAAAPSEINIYIQGTVLDPQGTAEALAELLRLYESTNGPVAL